MAEAARQPGETLPGSERQEAPKSGRAGAGEGQYLSDPAQQVQQLTGPANKAIVDTATFLKEQGKVPAVAADYSQYVTDRFVK